MRPFFRCAVAPVVRLVLALIALAGTAAARAASFELSAGVEPAALYGDYGGFEVDAGPFVGVGLALGELWSTELRLLDQSGDFVDVAAWQLGARRHFPTEVAWKPFVQGGLAFAQVDYEAPALLGRDEENAGLFVGGGTDRRFGDHFAVRLDGRLVVYESDLSDGTETELDLTVGVVCRF